MSITTKWLKENTTEASFSKGSAIAASQTIKVTQKDNVYTAKIFGTDIYEVTIEDGYPEPSGACDCPYDYEGYCKHIVALGLTIQKNNFKEVNMKIEIPETQPDYALLDHPDFFEEIFLKADPEKGTAFLIRLFNKNRDLRKQFLQYVSGNTKSEKENDSDSIHLTRTTINKKLGNLNLDIEDSYDSNYDGDDNGYDWGIAKIKEVLSPYFYTVRQALEKHDLKVSIQLLLGIYEGIHNVKDPHYNDDYGPIFEDIELELLNIYETQLLEITKTLTSVILPEQEILKAQDLIFERVNYYNTNPESRQYPMVYDFRSIEPLLLTLVVSVPTAEHLLQYMKNEEVLEEEDLIFVLQEIGNYVDIGDLWLVAAEKNYLQHVKIAKELLNYYKKHDKQADFYRIARAVFEATPIEICEFLAQMLNPAEDRDFYVKVLSFASVKKQNILYYERISPLLTESEKNNFIQQIPRLSQSVFYVNVLAYEEQFDKILRFVQANKSDYQFVTLARPILQVFPKECFDLVTEKAVAILAKERGRDIYTRIAKELALMLEVPAYTTTIKDFSKNLQAKYRNLPALKDELHLARLI
jgi:hypothetical protein